jgi:hypothetical protein
MLADDSLGEGLMRKSAMKVAACKGGICVYDPSGEPFAIFFQDGRIKISTRGRNTHANLSRINACLPPPYCIRKRDRSLALLNKISGTVIAEFLTSATFTPNPIAIADAREGATCN